MISSPPDSKALAGSYKKAVCRFFAVVKSWERCSHKDLIGLRLSCYVQPWLPEAGHQQVLMSTLDVKNCSGVAVFLDISGTLGLYIGTGTSVEQCDTEIRLRRWKWAELHLSVLKHDLSLHIRHLEMLTETAPSPSHYSHRMTRPVQLDGGKQPLTMAAGYFFDSVKSEPNAANMFNGRMDSPQMYITRDGISYTTWAKFDFALDMSTDRIVDTSGNANHGDLVNAPTRAVKGYDWDGSEPDWTKARYGYGAIHFHDDDLDDAAWATDFSFEVPKDTLSGAYAVIVQSVDHPKEISDHIMFFVRPTALDNPSDKPGPEAAIASVLSTFTYLAYANERMYDQSRASRISIAGGLQGEKDPLWRCMARRADLGCSVYDDHKDGSGCVFSTAKRPILNIRPGYVNWAFHRPREFSADQLMIGFMEEKLGRGGYDVLTDHDLHQHGINALEKYRVVVTGSHPEYPSLEVLNAYTAFTRNGGHLMYLGGNGFYWCSVLNSRRPHWHRLEVRKGDQGCRSTELLIEIFPSILQLGIAVYLLYDQLGAVCVAPVLITVICTGLSVLAAKAITSRQRAWAGGSTEANQLHIRDPGIYEKREDSWTYWSADCQYPEVAQRRDYYLQEVQKSSKLEHITRCVFPNYLGIMLKSYVSLLHRQLTTK